MGNLISLIAVKLPNVTNSFVLHCNTMWSYVLATQALTTSAYQLWLYFQT